MGEFHPATAPSVEEVLQRPEGRAAVAPKDDIAALGSTCAYTHSPTPRSFTRGGDCRSTTTTCANGMASPNNPAAGRNGDCLSRVHVMLAFRRALIAVFKPAHFG